MLELEQWQGRQQAAERAQGAPLALPARPRILVVSLRRIGDLLLTTPLIRSLRRAWPDARIDVLVFKGTDRILAGNPDIDDRHRHAGAAGFRGERQADGAAVEALRSRRLDPKRRPADLLCADRRTARTAGLVDIDGPAVSGALKRFALKRTHR